MARIYRMGRGRQTKTSSKGESNLTPAAGSALREARRLYEPGGGFEAGVQANLAQERNRFLSSTMSSLINAGLANTTRPAALASSFSSDVAAPTLANVESQRVQNLSNLLMALSQAEQGAAENRFGRQQQITMSQLNQPTSFQPSGVSYSPGVPSAGFLTGGRSNFQPAAPVNNLANRVNQPAPNLFA